MRPGYGLDGSLEFGRVALVQRLDVLWQRVFGPRRGHIRRKGEKRLAYPLA